MQFYIILLIKFYLLLHYGTRIATTTAEYDAKIRLPRIAVGERDPEDAYHLTKFLVSIRSRSPVKYFGDNHFCSGVLVTREHVLTAAHCVLDKRKVLNPARRMLVVGGTWNRLALAHTVEQYPVDWMKAHLNFTLYNTNDIAIVHLTKPVPKNSNVVLISQLANSTPPYGEKCLVVGWGRLYHRGPLGALVLYASVDLLPRDVCASRLSIFTPDMLCAGDANFVSDKGPCRGDTGGPLVCNERITGIISHGVGCGRPSKPSIYTDVYHNLDWIESVVNSAPFLKHYRKIFFTLFIFYLIFGSMSDF